MPKTKVAPRPPDDVPLWDALVAELGDPRPYEPTEIPVSLVVEDDAFFDVWSAHARDVVDTDRAFDDLISELDDADAAAAAALDAIWVWPEPEEIGTSTVALQLVLPHDEPTVTIPALGTLDQLNNPIDQT